MVTHSLYASRCSEFAQPLRPTEQTEVHMSHAITLCTLQAACALPQECAASTEVDLRDDVKQDRGGGWGVQGSRAELGKGSRGGGAGKRNMISGLPL